MRRVFGVALAALLLGATLGGCSDIYFARRDTIAPGGGDAVAANSALQVVDPWPPQSGHTNIGFDGERMEGAIHRYRTDTVTQPIDPMALMGVNGATTTTTNSAPASSSSGNTTSAAPAGGTTSP